MNVIPCPVGFANFLAEKNYGVVQLRGGTKFIRNYRRELKNGKGMNYFDAMYAAHFPIDYLPLFDA